MSEPYFNGPLVVLIRRLIIHSPPDPWSPEIDAAIKDSDAIPLCPDCLSPQKPVGKFCAHCQYPTGDFVPLMPYEQILCCGEVLRRGVRGPGRNRPWQNFGFVLFALSQASGLISPIYWFWLLSKAAGKPLDETRRRPPESMAAAGDDTSVPEHPAETS